MGNVSSFLSKQTLDWMTGAATQPTARWVGLRDNTSSEVGSRMTVVFAAAASPTQSASNAASLLFGPLSASGVVFELAIFDGSRFSPAHSARPSRNSSCHCGWVFQI
jgi:hypothetical protein